MIFWPFRRKSASDAARTMRAQQIANERERIKQRTVQMGQELGLPIPDFFR